VDVIADAGAVWRRIFRVVDVDALPFADCYFAGNLDEMRRAGGCLLGAQFRIGARDVE